MRPGATLTDARTGQARFQVQSLLASGKHYQIALGQDTRMENKQVCLKSIEYDPKLMQQAGYLEGRRDALRRELELLTLPSHLLPEPLDWLEIEAGALGAGAGLEPVLVYEYQHGEPLYDMVRARAPQGMHPHRALRMIRELAKFCDDLHERGYVFRDFDPRHIIVGFDDIIHLVGCGNAVKRGESMNVFKMNTNPRYTAPEIRRELSGKVVRPACDVYSLGCLLSFLLTGIEPTPTAEAPLEADAYDLLRSDQTPEGVRLLIARCLQPLAQKRFGSARKLLAHCEPDNLPKLSDPDFGLVGLPAPWDGPEGMDNRALRSKLSAGPLVSVRHEGRGGNDPSRAPADAPLNPMPLEEPASRAAGEDKLQPVPPDAIAPASRTKQLIMLGAALVLFVIIALALLAAVVLGVLSQ